MSKNIFKDAESIVIGRTSDQAKEYGNFDDSMESQETIYACIENDKDSKIVKGYKRMLALKISRLKYNQKHDTLLDLVAYAGALDVHVNKVDNIIIDKVLNFKD